MELEESIEHLQPKNNENAIKDRYQASHGGNIVTRKMEFDRGIPLSFDFVSNEIYTIKHKIHSQFLLVVSKFFKRPVQVLLIVLNILYLIAYLVIDKPVSNLQIYFVFIPQIALLILEIILELIEYFKIIYNDNKTNNQAAHIYDNDLKSFVSTSWKNIRVGQIIKVNKDEIVPADIIILETLDSNHLCYIDESSITGVFDAFKIKRACIDTLTPVMKPIKINEYLKNMKGMFKYEEPNAELKYFSGRLKLESFPRASDVNIENFVMRGSSVKNIKCVYGLVVYAGMETKIMQIIQSEKKSEIIKKGRNLITYSFVEIQFLIIFVYICLVADYAISLLGKNYYGINNKSTIKYLEITDWWEEYVVSLLQFSFSIQLFIPYIWFNLIYIAYYILETLIIWDAKVRRKPKYTVDIIHNDCLADFGQVKYILSDKTGTLTKRKFIVKACFVDDKYLSLDPLDKVDENFIFKEDDIQWVKKLPIYRELEIEKRELASTNKEGPISAFLEGLCICHSVKLRKKDSIFVNNDKVFGASFAEEKAIFKVLKNLDFSLNKTKNDKIILEIGGDTKIYYIVGRNRYSEERQRMSIIVKKRKTDNDSILYCKGNDASILHNINFKNDEDKQNLLDQIKRMANLGFRFFIFAKKFLFEDDTNTFITKYKSAENNMIQREVFFENLANEYETDLDFMGILFFEEEFTTELRQSIMKLDNAGIRTWIISGDKRDNVVSVAKNLEMVSHNSNIVEFAREDDLDDLDIKMNLHLMQFIGGNNDKYNKDKIENDANIDGASSNNNMLKISRNETSVAKKTLNKELFMFIDGDCFNLICNDTRLFQSFTILLSYTKGFFGYSFSPNNKYRFTKIMQDYVTHNSKLLAIGDGLNDLMMLKEADLSIGIRSREILQVRNTCDIIVSTFPQITDILLVHGTWNLHRLTTICMFSFYACTLIAFPYILNYRLLSFGAVFPSINYLILMLQLITINISLIIILCFDQNIERPIIGIAPKVYTQNYMNKYDKYKKFIYEFLKGIIDSLIIYYGINYSLKFPINSIGQVSDKLLIDTTIAFASFMVVYLKLIFCYMNIINILSVSIAVISYAGLVGFNFIYLDEHIITIEAFGFLNIIFAFICVVFSSFLLEVIFMNLKLFMFVNLVTYLSNEFKHRINDYSLFLNFFDNIKDINKIMDKRKDVKEKTNFVSVAKNLHKTYKNLDSVIENISNMEDHKIASLKLTNDLKYYDLKLENDYTPYLSNIILKIFIFYVVSHIIFLGYILIYQGVFTVLDDSKVSTILYAVWISISLLFTLPKIKENLKKYFVFYYFLGLLMQIISIYVEEEYNDLKIGVLFLFNISFALMFNLREFKSTITGTIFYLLALLPALFLKSKYLVNKNLFEYSEIISATTDDEEYSTPLEYSNFLKEHIGLYVIIAVIILSSALILFLYSYDQELYSRINFLKIDHKKLQFKKDQEIFDNLVPKFIQNKMESGSNRGASIDEEIVTVIFVDICDFDGLVTKMSPKEFINLLDKIYSTFDQLCSIHGLQKIETVSKTYMASGGIRECEKDLDPVVLSKHHSVRTFELALDMIDLMSKMRLDNGDTLKIKVGIHSREVNAAVVGNHKPQFSLIGDTVNTTARMCAYSKEMSILVTEEAYAEISKFYQDFVLIERQVKGKGLMKTYLCTPIKSKQEQEQDKQAKSLFTNFLKSALNKRGREGGILADLDLGSEKIERKNSFKSNNSSFIIDSFGTDKDKIKPLIDFTIIDPTIKHKNLENWLYKFSCFFLNFYDSNLIPITSQKKEKPSVLFENYSAHKYNNTFMTGIYINYIFCFGASMISYFYTYYNLTLNYNNEVIGIKLLLTITLIYITNRVKHSHNIRNQNLTYLVCFLYFCFIILLQVQFNIYSKEFFIFLTIEQNFTIVAAFFNCIINYMQTFFLMILFIVSFCVCIAVGHDEQLIVRYSICSILISLLFFGYYLFREYIGTIEYVENKMQSEELKNRERLLFNLMPPHVVQYLKEDIPVVDELFDVTMLYTDIVKFTDFSMAQSSPKNVVRMLIELFRRFDDAVLRNDVYKVHTIGDCYVVLGFTGKVPSNERDPAEEAMKVINLGKEMISIIKEVAASKEVNFPALNMRIGIHTGTIIAGIIGTKIVRYDIFGSDNAVANKMESEGQAGRVNISEDTKRLIESSNLDIKFGYDFNKIVQVKGVVRDYKSYLINFDIE